jgi:Zn finger protein HypA/HybF involved in hydrogenase expression
MNGNSIRSYKCDRCGLIKDYLSSPVLPDQLNVIAADCPTCFLGHMIIDFDNELNFTDNYLEKYFNL